MLRAVDPRELPLGEPVAELAAPIRPGKIVAIGLNYLDHIRESNLERPERPLVFAKFPSSVIGPSDAIELDEALTSRVDWEVELAVVVGSACGASSGTRSTTSCCYAVGNDVSARDVQFSESQWVRAELRQLLPARTCRRHSRRDSRPAGAVAVDTWRTAR